MPGDPEVADNSQVGSVEAALGEPDVRTEIGYYEWMIAFARKIDAGENVDYEREWAHGLSYQDLSPELGSPPTMAAAKLLSDIAGFLGLGRKIVMELTVERPFNPIPDFAPVETIDEAIRAARELCKLRENRSPQGALLRDYQELCLLFPTRIILPPYGVSAIRNQEFIGYRDVYNALGDRLKMTGGLRNLYRSAESTLHLRVPDARWDRRTRHGLDLLRREIGLTQKQPLC
jgi:hypothetical protein